MFDILISKLTKDENQMLTDTLEMYDHINCDKNWPFSPGEKRKVG